MTISIDKELSLKGCSKSTEPCDACYWKHDRLATQKCDGQRLYKEIVFKVLMINPSMKEELKQGD
jgi:hypothetical protein